MKVAVSLLLVLGTIIVGKMITVPPDDVTSAQEVAPAFAKWGRLAMQRVMEKYPNSEILDYLHIGRELGPTSTVEKFKLWLKKGNREFGVIVDITFKNDTEEIIDIKYTESTK